MSKRRNSFEKHVIVGSNSVVLPRVTLKMGSAVGALSLVNKFDLGIFIWESPQEKLRKDKKKS